MMKRTLNRLTQNVGPFDQTTNTAVSQQSRLGVHTERAELLSDVGEVRDGVVQLV